MSLFSILFFVSCTGDDISSQKDTSNTDTSLPIDDSEQLRSELLQEGNLHLQQLSEISLHHLVHQVPWV